MLSGSLLSLCLALTSTPPGKMATLESPALRIEVDQQSGQWSLLDRRSRVRWPSTEMASCGEAAGLAPGFDRVDMPRPGTLVLHSGSGAAVVFALVENGTGLELRYEGDDLGEIRVLGDLTSMDATEDGWAIVPCREGLLIPASRGKAFLRTFGTSDYEGCHMNMLGFLKRGSALVVSWDDAYVSADLEKTPAEGVASQQRLSASLRLRRTARSLRLRPLGQGDWNDVAASYRQIAERKELASTLRAKIARNADAELLVGASNFKLWKCLARRMNEASTAEEFVTVHWTFDEAARIAEHLHRDLGIDRCLFVLGGWSEGGYDCRHPDNLPANPECGGNEGLADAIRRIQDLGFVACLHDNYQDMYRDAKSWNPDVIEKRADGSLITGGRWLGGRAYMVCAPQQLELAKRPQNLPGICKLFPAKSYFIDTTYAVGPRECHDPMHPLGRNDDIRWKAELSDFARKLFGLFGSECGREWALAHSDFFEGLVGVSGSYYHDLKPADLGAIVIPFWEMVYHDCQIAYGKYGYAGDEAAEYVGHHVLCARPLHYHRVPDHLYWKTDDVEPGGIDVPPTAARRPYTRADQGWAHGLHPLDVFAKNTHEILGPLHAETAHERLTRLEFLTADRTLRKAVYGEGGRAAEVFVNFGAPAVEVSTRTGGRVALPPWGFVVEAPRFLAFYALRYNDVEYVDGALFTLRSLDGESMGESERIRIFHGFGEPHIHWQGVVHHVVREEVVTTE